LAIAEVQTAVSVVLKTSTSVTLKQYEEHINAIQDEYVPYLEKLQVLQPSECKNDAEFVLNKTTTNVGYRVSNCALEYDNRVRNEIDIATRALIRFDDIYSQVQSYVVKSFIGQNAFLTPEDIRDRIIAIYELIESKWEGSRPEVEAIKRNLSSGIERQNAELTNCHNANMVYARTFFGIFREDVNTCTIFDNTPNPFSKSSKGKSGYVSKRAEVEAALEAELDYEWKA
jgi:hypothetical protein